jgi:mannose-1-phosphate guanylyltransferase/mannose-6-phosphate isomerase
MGLITPVVLSGGAGTRLWPLSRRDAPKQFLPLVEGRSTFAMTLERVADSGMFARPLVVAARAQRFLVREALRAAAVEADVLLEPVPRDTAAAVAAAATVAARLDPDGLLLVLAADHLILDAAAFAAAVETARAAAGADYIVTFGVVPDAPATNYGYLGRGEALPGLPAASRLSAFKEKPDPATAKELVAAGYLWNSGNFMMRASLAIAETERYAPDIAAPVAASVANAAVGAHATVLDESAYRTIPAMSFDYAVMERTERAAVVEAGFDWRDLGTWESLREIAPRDAAGNASVGDVVVQGSRDCYVYAAKGKVAIIGVDNLVVATGEDAVLVAARDHIDSLREVVAALNRIDQETGGEDSYKVSPWGYFQVIEEGTGYKVKRIVVEPGGRLSLQRHAHRAEHWVVVAGTAEITVGSDTRRLAANQSVFIPRGGVHRLANPGEELLTVIEVQFGDYLGEDDIERLADDYDRLAGK